MRRASKITSKQRGRVSCFQSATRQPSFGNSDADEIQFYDKDGPYYEFTNFYAAGIVLDDKMWPTTEHYFQAQKFFGTPYVEMIRNLPTPREAFQMARDPAVTRWKRKDWEDIKDGCMLKALKCKFAQHRNLAKKLVETGDKQLVEHTANDSYWGDGGDGSGQNKLGKLLMQVRRELQASGQYKPSSQRRATISSSKPFSGVNPTTSTNSFLAAKYPTPDTQIGSGVAQCTTHLPAHLLAGQRKYTNQSSVPYNILSGDACHGLTYRHLQ